MSGWESTAVIAAASLVGWLATQAQARTRSIAREVRWLRETDLLKDRYIHRLEDALARADIDPPDHPDGWDEHMKVRDF